MSRVPELFDRALRRTRISVPPSEEVVRDSDGFEVRFHACAVQGRVHSLEYRCSTCATLVAACEAIVEIAPQNLEQAGLITAESLIESVGGVPEMRHGRFHLAVAALRQAISRSSG